MSAGTVMRMQALAGNRAVARMLDPGAAAVGPIRASAAEPHGPAVTSVVQRKPAEDRQRACEHYEATYNEVLEGMDSIRLSPGALRARLHDMQQVAGDGTLEDYTDEVFGNDEVIRSLGSVAKKTVASEDSDVVDIVNDALLFTSLVPAREERHRQRRTFGATSVYARRAIEVMSVNKLIALLRDVSVAATVDEDVFTGADSLKGIRYRAADSLAARMAKLSLVNMKEAARRQLEDDEFFQALVASPALSDVLMASSGADEQQFLNTCAASAVNQQVLGQVSTLAGLLLVGRTIADRVEGRAHGAGAQQTERKMFGKKRTMQELAVKRVTEARREFDAIQTQALQIVTSGGKPLAGLVALTRRWSRQMQKLAGVLDLSGGTSSVPVLSKKVVPEAWLASAVLSTASVVVPADRTMRRREAIDQDVLVGEVGKVVDLPTTAQADRKLTPSLTGPGADANLESFWHKVFSAGGAMFNTASHSLYVKAIKRGGERIFAVGDPKGSRYDYKNFTSFAAYARNNDIMVAPHLVP